MIKLKPSALAALALSSVLAAQDAHRAKVEFPAGVSHIAAAGVMSYVHLDLDSGRVSTSNLPFDSSLQRGSSFSCYANNVDQNDTGVLGNVLDALLFPAGEQLFDWGLKFCGGSGFVDRIQVGYASMAVDPNSGGPGGGLTLRVYTGGQGFGSKGTELAAITLAGLPSDGGLIPLTPFMLTVDLGSQAFFLPDGPTAWSYENTDGLTAPLLVDVTLPLGTQNFLDLYRPRRGQQRYVSTFTLPAGGFSGDPLENSFWIELFQRDELGVQSNLPAGSNPNVLSAANRPIVGGKLSAAIDLSGFPNALQSFAVLTTQVMPAQMTGAGTLLVDLSTISVPLSVSANGTHTLPIPLNASIVGLDFYLQGLVESAGSSFQLTNALGLSVGSF